MSEDLSSLINNVKNMVDSGNVPDNIKELLNREIDYKKEFKIKHLNLLEQISSNETYRRLYTKLLDGKRASRAVEEVVNENYYNNIKPSSESSIWRYYNNLKKLIKW